MKTIEEKQNEVNSISEKTRELQDEAKTGILDINKHLIGTCFNAGNATYMKITSIEDVDRGGIGIKGLCISLKEDVLPIRFGVEALVTENFITDNYIPNKRFSALFDMVVERLKEDYGINKYIY